ncbi:tripartite tricarboxylate transporter TctB family protein [Cobetia sp. QF-1]|uniref:tripartite tricarboxylate transporter TctB family protein n=1 Tax=Cobetia sp. QF-1 TaxID=1969833 RepID=UPI000B538F22|nr:tripartite tricarboxylate transporter TctB family protein [Cobetia sp. QF-1]
MHHTAPQPPPRHWLISGSTPLTLALTALSGLYLISALQLASPMENGRLSPSFFPLLIGLIACVLCLAQLIANYRASRQSLLHSPATTAEEHHAAPDSTDESEAGTAEKEIPATGVLSWFTPALRLMTVTALYILAFSHLGYLLSSALYVYAIMLLFSGRQKWMSKALIACVIAGLGYVLFEQLFNVHLPTLELPALGLGSGS